MMMALSLMVLVEQNRLLFSYRTDLLEYFVGKKKKKHVEVFFGSYDS